jgi:AraC family transcriptional regulator
MQVSDARKGVRLSEIIPQELGAVPQKHCSASIFPFPPTGESDGGVTVTLFDRVPPLDGCARTFAGHVLAVHRGRPLPIRQQREDLHHEWTFTRGDLTLIPAGWETICWTQQISGPLLIEIDRAFVRRAVPEADREVEMPCLFSFDDPVCRELSLSMLAEARAHGAGARLYVESAAVVLTRRLSRMTVRPVAPISSKSGLPVAILRRAKAYLHDEMNRNPGVAELSAAVGMNHHHFSRMFKRSTGLAPYQYQSNIRLERAKQLLAEGCSPIIDIAFETGYSNPSQFSTFFRKRTGVSPSDFRRRAGGRPPSAIAESIRSNGAVVARVRVGARL